MATQLPNWLTEDVATVLEQPLYEPGDLVLITYRRQGQVYRVELARVQEYDEPQGAVLVAVTRYVPLGGTWYEMKIPLEHHPIERVQLVARGSALAPVMPAAEAV